LYSIIKEIFIFTKRYPIPVFSIIGLTLGTVSHYVLNSPGVGHWIWFFTLVACGIPIVFDTIKGMFQRHFAADIVATLAILTAIITNDTFPGVVIVIMQSGGKSLEDYAYRRATASLDELLKRSPKIAHRKKNKEQIEDIDVATIRIGDVLVIRPGDLIPADGTIISGSALIDESSITGEPFSKTKGMGEGVLSGTVNTGGAFEIEAIRIAQESQYSKIVKLVEKAKEEKAPIQILADKYAVWFTPLTLIMCGFGWLFTQNVESILSVLVVATPCPLIFAAPVAIIGGINKAAKQNIIVKNGAAIEQISKADVLIFDKTGTITYGEPVIEEILLLDNSKKNNVDVNIQYTKDDILFKVASLEQLSSHSSAQSIVREAKKKFKELILPTGFREKPGLGVAGYVSNDYILIGTFSFIESERNRSASRDTVNRNDDLLNLIKGLQKHGKMAVFVNINGINVGIIKFADKIRKGTHIMVRNLKKDGIKETVMLTGDSEDNAKYIANKAGIDSYNFDLLPEDKVNEVKKLKEKFRNIIMIGDGINDAPALATATVGVAMGAKGTAISVEAADVVLLEDDITMVSKIIHIGKATVTIVKQSIFVGMGISFFLMILASLGLITPSIGAMLQEALDIGVILNALRAK
jgi:heavy metal translocating P-type ATPase